MASNELNELLDGKEVKLSSPLNALFVYILEGILPLISAFCSEFALHITGSCDAASDIDQQLPILVEIAKSIAVRSNSSFITMTHWCCEYIMPGIQGFHRTKVLISSGHLHRIKTCLSDMKNLFTAKGAPDQQALDIVKFTMIVVMCTTENNNVLLWIDHIQAISSLTTQSLQRNRAFSNDNLLDSESPETQLNNTFQLYVENYRRAYEELTDTTIHNGTCTVLKHTV